MLAWYWGRELTSEHPMLVPVEGPWVAPACAPAAEEVSGLRAVGALIPALFEPQCLSLRMCETTRWDRKMNAQCAMRRNAKAETAQWKYDADADARDGAHAGNQVDAVAEYAGNAIANHNDVGAAEPDHANERARSNHAAADHEMKSFDPVAAIQLELRSTAWPEVEILP